VIQYKEQEGGMTIGTENRRKGIRIGEEWTRKRNDRIDK